MGKELRNISRLKITRKKLRNNQTKSEQIIWNKLKWKQFLWLKFRRQHSIWRYILDFYCPEKKLAIEIDWENHAEEEQKEYDTMRTDFLNSAGIKVVRYTNEDIMKSIDWVLQDLTLKLWE